jgi:hypothetical protein
MSSQMALSDMISAMLSVHCGREYAILAISGVSAKRELCARL